MTFKMKSFPGYVKPQSRIAIKPKSNGLSGFNLKSKLSAETGLSPLHQNIDPNSGFEITVDETVGNETDYIREMERERLIEGAEGQKVEKIETDDQKFIDSFRPEYSRLIETGEFTGTIEEFIAKKSEKYQDTPDELITEVRTLTGEGGSPGTSETVTETKPLTFFHMVPDVDFESNNWSTTENGQQAMEFFSGMTNNIMSGIPEGGQGQTKDNMMRKILMNSFVDQEGINITDGQGLFSSIIIAYKKDPEKVENIIRKYFPYLVAKGGNEEIESQVVTEGTDAVNTDTGWNAKTGNPN